MKDQIDALRRAEQGIDTAANIETRPEIKPEIVDVLPEETKPDKPVKRDEPAKKTQPVMPEQPMQPVEPENQGGGEDQP